jgi:hypothetical protein
MSPLSAGGFGRQLAASNASVRQTATANGKLWDVVFLMEARTPPDCLDRPKSLCRLRLITGGVFPSIPHPWGSWEEMCLFANAFSVAIGGVNSYPRLSRAPTVGLKFGNAFGVLDAKATQPRRGSRQDDQARGVVDGKTTQPRRCSPQADPAAAL